MYSGKKSRPGKRNKTHPAKEETSQPDGLVRLNKRLANAGTCSRREADELIVAGLVSVNGKIVTKLGTKVSPSDVVKFHDQPVNQEKPVYLLLNKPKDYITTTDDPMERKTVMALIKGACRERVYPVGRLDRATTGLLLFTNDGDLTMKLTHPASNISKLYHVELDKGLKPADFEKITNGVKLDDGMAYVDEISYAGQGYSRSELGVSIHSGRNRIVRRIFESLGYKVTRLDRVAFAGLTKKDLPRGRWRFLTPKEIAFLKMLKK